jgi:hypothetical protein
MTQSLQLSLAALVLAACGTESPAAPVSVPPPGPEAHAAAKGQVGGVATVENDWVVLHVQQPAFQEACVDEPKLEKWVDGKWLPVQDDRPAPARHPGYYVDDTYVRASANEGCDVRGCVQVRESWRVAQASEFVRAGTRPDAEGKEVERFETRPLAVPVRVLVSLHRNARCDGAEVATFDLKTTGR